MINRRHFLLGSAAGLVASSLPLHGQAQEHDHSGHTGPERNDEQGTQAVAKAERTDQGYRPVVTPNGRTLGYRYRDGVKEFHLIAEEVEHEFAPGTRIKAWGYNGSTPGPTIEAVEGDKVRIYVTNRLGEPTSVHWHGLLLPAGMDGVAGLNQPSIKPGETFVYEFTLKQHGTHMYHPHGDEMVQMSQGMMGMFIIHPKTPEDPPIDRDYAILLHNWSVHPGTYRADPSVMQDFDLWTMNSKVFPAIDELVAQTGERVRIRLGNLSMWNHPMHLHGVQFHVTGSDGGRWPQSQWRAEVTEIIGVGQTRDLEFEAVAGDWAFHCHMAHHTMNAMGHGIPNTIGADQSAVEKQIQALVPGYMAMGEHGMAEHQDHTDSGHMQGPANTLPMMMGQGPFGNLEMGGMFTLVKVRDRLDGDPGWYQHPEGTVAHKVERVPDDLPR
ncbi:copper oxidase [Marinimicrobium sp. C6131]|uniref:multicopper oxidase family protein n=1 Tax=Marinimicrobium sp. C6131 TaxID=3022676 RepID=UPI00223DCE3D|nr:copper oxidase [Marinimicrobium sp. C6131]UZJ45984.1 copper oxidase [Marinimicrobium sp. C6131]